jgi:hypothetical protein
MKAWLVMFSPAGYGGEFMPLAGSIYKFGSQTLDAHIFGQYAAITREPSGLGLLPRQRVEGGLHNHDY